MKHSQYLSTARTIFREIESKTLVPLIKSEKIVILGGRTSWSHSQRTKIVEELEGESIFISKKDQKKSIFDKLADPDYFNKLLK